MSEMAPGHLMELKLEDLVQISVSLQLAPSPLCASVSSPVKWGLIASMAWPCWVGGLSCRRLARELLTVNLPWGACKEQVAWPSSRAYALA